MMITGFDIHLPKASNQISHAIFSCHLLWRNICIDRNTESLSLSLSSLWPYRKYNWSLSLAVGIVVVIVVIVLVAFSSRHDREKKENLHSCLNVRTRWQDEAGKGKWEYFSIEIFISSRFFSSRTMKTANSVIDHFEQVCRVCFSWERLFFVIFFSLRSHSDSIKEKTLTRKRLILFHFFFSMLERQNCVFVFVYCRRDVFLLAPKSIRTRRTTTTKWRMSVVLLVLNDEHPLTKESPIHARLAFGGENNCVFFRVFCSSIHAHTRDD